MELSMLRALTLTLTLRCSSLPLFPFHLFLSTPTHRPPQSALLLDRWSIYRTSLAILHSQQQGEKLSAVAVVHHMLQLIVDLAGLSEAMAGLVSLLTRL